MNRKLTKKRPAAGRQIAAAIEKGHGSPAAVWFEHFPLRKDAADLGFALVKVNNGRVACWLVFKEDGNPVNLWSEYMN